MSGPRPAGKEGPRPSPARERGDTLIEVIVALAILTILGLGAITAILTAIEASAVHRAIARSEVVARNVSAAIADAPYVPCAATTDYEPAAAATAPAGYAVKVTRVERWNGDDAAAQFGTFPGGCGPAGAAPGDDTELQRVTFQVTSPARASHADPVVRTLSTVKGYDGTTSRSDQIPTGAVRCTVTATDAHDAAIDGDRPGQATGTQDTMAVGRTATGVQAALLRFDLRAGTTPCRGTNDTATVLPAGSADLVVLRAQIRLYRWQTTGAPTCPTQCGVALERATGVWDDRTVTASSAPPTIAPGRSTFELPGPSGDFAPRYVLLDDAGLTSDVQEFTTRPDSNLGWKIVPACAPTYLGRSCTAPADFHLRTSEWRQPEQRPALEIVFVPRSTSTIELRNTTFGRCASVRDDAGDTNGASLIALTCNGKSYQGWNYADGSRQLRTTASTDNVGNRRCVDVGESRQSPRSNVMIWSCDSSKVWQQVWFDGSAIKARQKVANVTVDQCLEIEGGNRLVGTRLIFNDCNGRPEQQWSPNPQQPAPKPPTNVVRIRNALGDNCLDIEAAKADRPPYWTDNSSGVAKSTSRTEGFPCFGGSRGSQGWLLNGYDQIVNIRDQTACLDADGGGDTAFVRVNYCNNGSNQQWAFEPVGDRYRIRVVSTSNCLEGGYDAYQVRVRTCSDANLRQQWSIEPATASAKVSRGWLRNEGNFNTCMEPDKDQAPDAGGGGAWIWAWPCSADRPHQEFLRLRVSATEVQYRPMSNLAYCFDVAGGGNNQAMISYPCQTRNPGDASSATDNQRLSLLPAADLAVPTLNDPTARQLKLTQGRCLQVVTGDDGADYVRARTCVGNPDTAAPYQRWYFEQIGVVRQDTFQARSVLRADSGCAMPFDALPNNGNDRVTTWPCSGGLQPKQALVRLTSGQIRLSSQVSRCLDSRSNSNGAEPYFNGTCGTQYQQRWKYTDLGGGRVWIRLQDYPLCLKAGLDMAKLTMATCDTASAANLADRSLQWKLEPFGTASDPRIGQIRGIDSRNCLETVPGGGLGEGRRTWGWPCASTTRTAQQWIALNNGQIRPVADTRYCLDDANNMGSSTNVIHLWTCRDPVETQQVWGQDVNDVRSVVVPDGTTTAEGRPIGLLRNGRMASKSAPSCVREVLASEQTVNSEWRNGDYAMTRNDCSTAAARQRWAFEATGIDEQRPQQVRLVMRSDSGCMEPVSADARANMWTWPCSGTTRSAQAFTVTFDGQIKNPTNGAFCFDARNVAVNDVPYFSDCHGGSNQRWLQVPVAGRPGVVQLRVNDNRNGAICAVGNLDATTLRLAACNAAEPAQWFTFEDWSTVRTTRYVKVRNAASGRCMQPDGAVNNGRSVWAWECDDPLQPNTTFLATNNRQLHPIENLGYCLDYAINDAAPDRHLVTWTCHDQTNRDTNRSQLWTLQSDGRLTNDRDLTQCTREIAAADKAAPFNVANYSFLTTCLPATDTRSLAQRWTLRPATGP